jgi:hypothetical protein
MTLGEAQESHLEVSMFDFLNEGIWGSVFGLLGVIIGLIGILLYLKSRVRGKPTCFMRCIRLIGEQEQALPEEVKIVFNKVPVPRVSITTAYFWNDGRETIYGKQIVDSDPLRFEFEAPAEILKVHIRSCTREVNKIGVEPYFENFDFQSARLGFDYLDPGDGARIEILHTSTEKYPRLKGSLRGLPRGIKLIYFGKRTRFDKFAAQVYRSKFIKPIVTGIVFLGLVFFLTMGLIPTELFKKMHYLMNQVPSTKGGILSWRIAYLVMSGMFSFPLLTFWNRKRKKIYPPKLDDEK